MKKLACVLSSLYCLFWLSLDSATATIRSVPSAYPTIQEAIDAATDGDVVLVANGIYKGNGNKNVDFKGKEITVKSEGGAATCIIDCEGDGQGIVIRNEETLATRLEGFTIKNGKPLSGLSGGGIFIYNSSPTVINCVFDSNSSSGIYIRKGNPNITNCTFVLNYSSLGGGIAVYESSPTIANCTFNNNFGEGVAVTSNFVTPFSSNPILTGCTFKGNLGNRGGGLLVFDNDITVSNCVFEGNQSGEFGGGIHIRNTKNSVISNCTFKNNRAKDGSGMYVASKGNLRIINSFFLGNFASNNGGGIGLYGANPLIANCVFVSNRALAGGAIDFQYQSDPTICFCTFTNNMADGGGGLYIFESSPTIYNCVLWNNLGVGNSKFAIANTRGNPAVDYCDVDGGTAGLALQGITGVGIIDSDPLFQRIPYDGGDGWGDNPYSPGADEGANDDFGDMRLLSLSPCINVGSAAFPELPETDLDGNLRIVGSAPDMGAFESTVFPYNTRTNVSNATGKIGQAIPLRALLRRYPDAAGVAGKTLTFKINDMAVGTALTGTDGLASLNYVVPESLRTGTKNVTVAFVGDGLYAASIGTGLLTVNTADTVLSVNNGTGPLGYNVNLRASLRRRSDGAFLSGKQVQFYLNGSPIGSLKSTDAAGGAELGYTPPVILGTGDHILTATFAGDSLYNSSSSVAGILKLKFNVRASVPDTSGKIGQTVLLRAALRRQPDGIYLTGKTLTFKINGMTVGTGVLGADNIARLSYIIPDSLGTGARSIRAELAGDAEFNASTGTGTLTVNP